MLAPNRKPNSPLCGGSDGSSNFSIRLLASNFTVSIQIDYYPYRGHTDLFTVHCRWVNTICLQEHMKPQIGSHIK